MKAEAKTLKRRLFSALIAIAAALAVMASATFAWYIYTTTSHTTKVHMAAGSSASLLISNAYDGTYGYSTVVDSFIGQLTPVSTNSILNGFQTVKEFRPGGEGEAARVASIFEVAPDTIYYKTSLWLKTNGDGLGIYVSDIGYEDNDPENPISTAIRVGFVFHSPGQETAAENEYIFELNRERNPQAEYNTATGKDGYVLDSTKTDGTTVPFKPYNSDNYCNYDSASGDVTLKPESVEVTRLKGAEEGNNEPVEVEIYIWLEGCDADCVDNIINKVLTNMSVSFAGTQLR